VQAAQVFPARFHVSKARFHQQSDAQGFLFYVPKAKEVIGSGLYGFK